MVKEKEEATNTKRTPVFLSEPQIAWLKKQPEGISGTIRGLITEAVNLENLKKSVKKSVKKRK